MGESGPVVTWSCSGEEKQLTTMRQRGAFGGDGNVLHLYYDGDHIDIQPIRKAVQNYLKKLKMELPYDPAVTLWENFQRNPKY